MLKQIPYQEKKTESMFQCGHLYTTDAACGNLIPSSLTFNRGSRLFHSALVNEIARVVSDKDARTAFTGLHKERGITKKSSKDFPVKALSLFYNDFFSINNKFPNGTQNQLPWKLQNTSAKKEAL